MNSKFDKLFNILPDAALLIDKSSFRILRVNRHYDDKVMRGHKTENMLFDFDVLREDDRPVFYSAVELLANQIQDSVDILNIKSLSFVGADRFPVYHQFNWTIADLDDSVYIVIGKTVTNAAESVSEREKELIDFFQNAPIALRWVSSSGIIIWANDAELSAMGYTADEYIGHRVLEFCPDDAEGVKEFFSRLKNNETIHNARFKFRTKCGGVKYFNIDSNVSWHPDGSFNHTRCFIRDDSDNKIREAIQLSEVKQIKLAAEAKDRFIRKLFHEIRTPMHIISSSISSGAIHSYSKDEVLELSRITEDCLGLIEDLTFASMFEADNVFVPKSITINIRMSLSEIIANVKASLLPAVAKDILISLNIQEDMPVDLLCDKCLLRAMHNLIKNVCLSYQHSALLQNSSKQASPIMSSSLVDYTGFNYISNSPQRQLADNYNFCFKLIMKMNGENNNKDGGIPFAYDQIHPYFQQFYYDASESNESAIANAANGDSQSYSLTNSLVLDPTSCSMGSGGLGLGWFVSYNVIQNLGSVLDCEISADTAIFSFNLCADAVAISDIPNYCGLENLQSQSSLLRIKVSDSCLHVVINDELVTPEPLSKSERRNRVLIVDDSPICQKVMTKSLKTFHFETETAINGQEACDKLDHDPCLFDAVLMDLRMPVMDGITATKICKQKRHLANVPIIIVTADVGDNIRVAATDAGADYFMNKPARLSEIHEVLNRVLSLK